MGHRLVHRGNNSKSQEELVEKVKNTLGSWKPKCLSAAGRLTLAKSIISSMGVFQMQLQKMKKRTHKELDKAIRQCVWGSTPTKRRLHLLNWNVLCLPKKHGGTGLRRSEDMNIALLAKLGWHLFVDAEDIWCRLIKEKYGILDEGPVAFKNRQRASGFWAGIVWSSATLHAGIR